MLVCAPLQQPVVHQPLQHAGRHDAAAAHQHGAGLLHEPLVDVLVRLVGVDDVAVVVVVGAVALELGQELQARVADGEVDVLRAERDPLRGGRALGRRQDREVAAAVAPAHDADQALDQHLVVADPVLLALHRLEGLPGLRRVVVGEDRLGEETQQHLEVEVADALAEAVRREAPDVVRPRSGVGAEPLAAGDLGDASEVLVGLPRVVEGAEDPHLRRRDAGDPQVVDRHEAADPRTHGDERDVDDRDAGAGDELVGPEVRREHLVGQVTGRHRLRRQVRVGVCGRYHRSCSGLDQRASLVVGRFRLRCVRNATPATRHCASES